ncbi:MAG: autotransporter outer membrane beta-barrel domain-containing protein [Pseudomonadota bacterium]
MTIVGSSRHRAIILAFVLSVLVSPVRAENLDLKVPIDAGARLSDAWNIRYDAEFGYSKQAARDGLVPAEIDFWSHNIAALKQQSHDFYYGAGLGISELTYEDDVTAVVGLPASRSVSRSLEIFAEAEFAVSHFRIHTKLTAGIDDHEFSRPDSFSGSIAFASTSGHHFSGEIDFFTDFVLYDNLLVRPLVGIDFLTTETGEIRESGAGIFNLVADGIRDNRYRSEVGVFLASAFETEDGNTVSFGGTAQWIHNFRTQPVSVNASTALGVPVGAVLLFPGIDQNGILLNGGMQWRSSQGFELTLGYEGEFYDSLESHTFGARLILPISNN